eukprot:TRINITY_DN2040_c0_g1_i3.p1 TRINITY_DN2040_c0_g1~~TRINITY_DN2040_c0_g1_i3.p1  ORF type:complete len:402 (+),score=153.42 TRINITY_DN2040_c0_g1_i3:180-1208(+)
MATSIPSLLIFDKASPEFIVYLQNFNEFKQNFDRILQIIQQHANDLRPKRAFASMEALEELISHHENSNDISELKAKLAIHSVEYNRIRFEVGEINAFLEQIRDLNSFTVIEQDKEWRTLYRTVPGSALQTFRVEGDIEASAVSITALINEIDLFKTWVPSWGSLGLQDVFEIARLAKATTLLYGMIGLPWPFTPRDITVFASGSDNLDEGQVVIVVHSVDQLEGFVIPEEGFKIAPDGTKTKHGGVRLSLRGGFLMEPISPIRTKLTLLLTIEPKITWIPSSLINWGMKQFAHYGFTLLGKQAKNIAGTQYEQRIREKPALYHDLSNRLENYFASKQSQKL